MSENVRMSDGGRATRQGEAVEQAMRDAAGFLTAQEVYDRLRASGTRIGLATVYRHLQRLADQGALDALTDADGRVAYRRCSTHGHHHHLVCRRCGTTVEVNAPSVESWSARVAHESGFTDVTHTLEIFGVCRACR